MPTVHARKRAAIVLEQPRPVLLPELIIRPGPFRLASGVEIRPARARPVGWPLRPGSRPIRPAGLTGTIHLRGRTAAIRTAGLSPTIRSTMLGTSRSLATRLGAPRRTA